MLMKKIINKALVRAGVALPLLRAVLLQLHLMTSSISDLTRELRVKPFPSFAEDTTRRKIMSPEHRSNEKDIGKNNHAVQEKIVKR